MAAHWKGAAVEYVSANAFIHCKNVVVVGKRRRLTMLCLASGAMAQLRVKRFTPAQLIPDLATMAVGLVLDVELVIVLMDLVRRTLLPLIETFTVLLASGVLLTRCAFLVHVWSGGRVKSYLLVEEV